MTINVSLSLLPFTCKRHLQMDSMIFDGKTFYSKYTKFILSIYMALKYLECFANANINNALRYKLQKVQIRVQVVFSVRFEYDYYVRRKVEFLAILFYLYPNLTKVFIWVYCQTYTIDSSLLHSCCLNNILIFNFTEVLTIWMVILVFEVFSVSNISHNETFAAYLARAVSSIQCYTTKNVSFSNYNSSSRRIMLCAWHYISVIGYRGNNIFSFDIFYLWGIKKGNRDWYMKESFSLWSLRDNRWLLFVEPNCNWLEDKNDNSHRVWNISTVGYKYSFYA